MRYFCFNFIAKHHLCDSGNIRVVESTANEIVIQSESFPSRTQIVSAINNAFDRLEDIVITHKFEFNSEQDFRNYIGDEYISGNCRWATRT